MKERYNRKVFLLPNAINSMAATHAKVYEDRKEYQFRVSDCNSAIKLWGKTETVEDLLEGHSKLTKLAEEARELANHLLRLAKDKMPENE